MKNEINRLRELIHKELEAEDIDYEKILKMSQELDEYIVEYHRDKDEKS
ncbi:MAG: Spo0E family sporulation regulatory protein-aspartic acid phosphatase [Tissierellia bacterium]|nr:Spo0E family sporulation regulatory protein-aspartic acid phosphatase [Tissierellia bacterium]